jgi:hypothetical protein
MSTEQPSEQATCSDFDFVVVGGGLAGISAAIAAARGGIRTALVQNRPVLGGNSSSEIRVSPGSVAAYTPWALETGIVHELILEDRWRNHGRLWPGYTNSIWDLVLYEWVTREPCLELFLNTTVHHVTLSDDGFISSVEGVQLGTEKNLQFRAQFFCDATGDGTVAHLAGADFRIGSEARTEFDEPSAPEHANTEVMPSSILIRARDVGKPVAFRAPSWAVKYPDESILFRREHYDPENDRFLWLEVGPFDTIGDNEVVRDETLRHALGVWDHIKNYCVHKDRAANWALEWVGMVVGKRESRRIEGDYWLREQDVTGAARFTDTVAYGGHYVDHHNPRGLAADPGEHWIAKGDTRHVMVRPYAIPFRCMYAKAIPNLFLAGRCISATRMALGSIRLQPTLAGGGQAVGTAAALCHKYGTLPRQLGRERIAEVQQKLIRDDCFLPGVVPADPLDLATRATVSASSSSRLTLAVGRGEHELTKGLAQLIPISANRIDYVWLRLRSAHEDPVTVRLSLRVAENCWDFNQSEELAFANAVLQPGVETFLPFKVDIETNPQSLYCVYAKAREGVFWRIARDVPVGCVAAWQVEFKSSYHYHVSPEERFARALRVSPESHPYEPHNIIASPGRPDTWTNCWISDPDAGFPQSLTLRWESPLRFSSLCLVFDSNLNQHWRNMKPLSAPPELVREYEIQINVDGNWRTVVIEKENHVRHRVHTFETVISDGIRLVVRKTHGARSARLYAIRVYDEPLGMDFSSGENRYALKGFCF